MSIGINFHYPAAAKVNVYPADDEAPGFVTLAIDSADGSNNGVSLFFLGGLTELHNWLVGAVVEVNLAQDAQAVCSGEPYLINPDDPTEGTDIHHEHECPVHDGWPLEVSL